jgi:hypothetical protein
LWGRRLVALAEIRRPDEWVVKGPSTGFGIGIGVGIDSGMAVGRAALLVGGVFSIGIAMGIHTDAGVGVVVAVVL